MAENTDPKQKYSIMTFLEWDSLAEFQAATMDDESKVIFEDIKNFTKGTPEILTGEVLASS